MQRETHLQPASGPVRRVPIVPLALGFALLLGFGGIGAAGAQDKQFELTPYVSYLFDGDFELYDFEYGRVDFEVDEDTAFGLSFGIPITRSFLVELTYLRQQTELQIDEGLFEEAFTVADIDIDTFLAGVLFQGSYGQIRPFFSVGAGIADLSIDITGTDNEVKPAFSIGGGVKTMFTRNFGLRFEGRILAIVIDEDDGDRCCHRYDEGQTLTQGQVSAGLVFAF